MLNIYNKNNYLKQKQLTPILKIYKYIFCIKDICIG